VSSDMSSAARRVLARAKLAQPRAPEGMRERVKCAVLGAVTEPTPIRNAAANSGARRIATAPWLTKPWLAVSMFMLAGLGTVLSLSPSAKTPNTTTPRPDSLAAELAQPPLGAVPLQPTAAQDEPLGQTPNAQLPAASHALSEAQTPGSRTPDLRAEMAWLARAESYLRKRDPQAALRALEGQRERFEGGQLRAEREGLELIAQCMLGRAVAPALSRYLAGTPDGVLVARVRRACRATERR
jgi:hypothetical protein